MGNKEIEIMSEKSSETTRTMIELEARCDLFRKKNNDLQREVEDLNAKNDKLIQTLEQEKINTAKATKEKTSVLNELSDQRHKTQLYKDKIKRVKRRSLAQGHTDLDISTDVLISQARNNMKDDERVGYNRDTSNDTRPEYDRDTSNEQRSGYDREQSISAEVPVQKKRSSGRLR